MGDDYIDISEELAEVPQQQPTAAKWPTIQTPLPQPPKQQKQKQPPAAAAETAAAEPQRPDDAEALADIRKVRRGDKPTKAQLEALWRKTLKARKTHKKNQMAYLQRQAEAGIQRVVIPVNRKHHARMRQDGYRMIPMYVTAEQFDGIRRSNILGGHLDAAGTGTIVWDYVSQADMVEQIRAAEKATRRGK